MTRREVINNAEHYSIVAKKCSDKIDIIFLGKSEIEESIPNLEDMMKDTKVLPGTRKMHHLEVTGPGQVILIPISIAILIIILIFRWCTHSLRGLQKEKCTHSKRCKMCNILL